MAYRPRHWLFPMRDGEHAIDPRSAQKIYYAAKRRAGVAKRCGIHGLQHAFTTHLLKAGEQPHTIQPLLGHGQLSVDWKMQPARLCSTPRPLASRDRGVRSARCQPVTAGAVENKEAGQG